MSGEICSDNRFEIIAAYKKKLIEGTNIESSPDEMAVIDNILFRFWQMDWLPPIPHGRLIDASAKIRVQIYDDMTEDYHMAEMTIDDLLCQGWVEANASTIIPASVESEK